MDQINKEQPVTLHELLVTTLAQGDALAKRLIEKGIMTQAEFMSWIGPPQNPAPANPTGPVYLDNDGVTQNVSGSWGMGSGSGDGFLYVDGDLNLGSNFYYKGVIYIEGDLSMTGHAWILGAVIVRGAVHPIKLGGGGTILYSKDAINVALGKYASKFSTLSWREK